MKKEAEIKVIFDTDGGRWLYYRGEDGCYIHDYRYNGIEQLVSDAMKLAAGESPIKEGWGYNEIEDFSPIFDGESEDPSDLPLFSSEDENIWWWEV